MPQLKIFLAAMLSRAFPIAIAGSFFYEILALLRELRVSLGIDVFLEAKIVNVIVAIGAVFGYHLTHMAVSALASAGLCDAHSPHCRCITTGIAFLAAWAAEGWELALGVAIAIQPWPQDWWFAQRSTKKRGAQPKRDNREPFGERAAKKKKPASNSGIAAQATARANPDTGRDTKRRRKQVQDKTNRECVETLDGDNPSTSAQIAAPSDELKPFRSFPQQSEPASLRQRLENVAEID